MNRMIAYFDIPNVGGNNSHGRRYGDRNGCDRLCNHIIHGRERLRINDVLCESDTDAKRAS